MRSIALLIDQRTLNLAPNFDSLNFQLHWLLLLMLDCIKANFGGGVALSIGSSDDLFALSESDSASSLTRPDNL